MGVDRQVTPESTYGITRPGEGRGLKRQVGPKELNSRSSSPQPAAAAAA